MAVTKTSNRVIEGDDIEGQIAALPELMYLTRTNPNNPAIWETYNPNTGEIVDTGVFAGGGDQGLLRAAAPVIGLAASTVGLPFINSLLSGATGLTGSALAGATGATIGAGTQAVTGGSAEDIARAALLGGGGAYIGSQLNNLISDSLPIDASNMTSAQFNNALEGQLVADMQAAGLSNDQISAFLDDMGIGQGLTSATLPSGDISTATDDVLVTAPSTSLDSGVLGSIASTLPTVEITSDRPTTVNDVITQLISNGIISDIPTVDITSDRPITNQTDLESLISSLIDSGTITSTSVPEVEITSDRPKTDPTTIIDKFPPFEDKVIIDKITPTEEIVIEAEKDKAQAPTKPEFPPPKKIVDVFPTPPSISDIVKIISVVPIIDAIVDPKTPPTPPSFPIVDIPPTWTNPPSTTVAPFKPLPPIDFGNRNLLRGTQWEKFLNPNYGKVPAPVQYSQPSNLSYNDLMGILGSKQGMPSASSLSINDIISGIQNQYGQANPRAMG